MNERQRARGNRLSTSIMLTPRERERAEQLRKAREVGSLGTLIRELLLEEAIRRELEP